MIELWQVFYIGQAPSLIKGSRVSRMKKALGPLLDQETACTNMADIAPAFSPQEALIESQRCLFCFDAPCITACPAGIDIPGFIKKITTGHLTGSARTILEANVLGASCARVCPTAVLCEGACVLLDRDQQPIDIGRLQRYATDHVFDKGIDVLRPGATPSGKRVALIGGGPASLSCAAELVQRGHQATLFEKKPHAGGLNTYGIAYYKLTPETSLAEVEMIRRLGVEFRENCTVGQDVSMADIQAEYDAVFIGVGLGHTYRLGIPGEDAPEVVEALDFIADIHTQPLHEVAVGKKVVVIGCGNTAIDAVTQAIRLGAETSTILYRRGAEDMPAYSYEYELAKKDGCGFIFNAVPVEVITEEGQVTGIRMARTEKDTNGRLRTVKGFEWVEPCDMVIKALGQEKQQEMLQSLFPGLELDGSGCVVHDPQTFETSIAGVYTGGDCANGGSEVVNAVGEGKKAAHAIHEKLTGHAAYHTLQPTRLGAPTEPRGSGILHPIRVPELEERYVSKGE